MANGWTDKRFFIGALLSCTGSAVAVYERRRGSSQTRVWVMALAVVLLVAGALYGLGTSGDMLDVWRFGLGMR